MTAETRTGAGTLPLTTIITRAAAATGDGAEGWRKVAIELCNQPASQPTKQSNKPQLREEEKRSPGGLCIVKGSRETRESNRLRKMYSLLLLYSLTATGEEEGD